MKYIIIPLLKLLWTVIYLMLMIPTIILVIFTLCIWELSFNPLRKELKLMMDYDYSDNEHEVKVGEQYHYYRTVFDWLIGNKKYRTKQKPEIIEV